MAGGKGPEEVEREELAAAVFEGEKLERIQRRVLELRIQNALQRKRTRRDTIEECAQVVYSEIDKYEHSPFVVGSGQRCVLRRAVAKIRQLNQD